MDDEEDKQTRERSSKKTRSMTPAQLKISAKSRLRSMSKGRREGSVPKPHPTRVVPEEQIRLAKKINKRFKHSININEADRQVIIKKPGALGSLELFIEVMNLTFDFDWDEFMPNEHKLWPYNPGTTRPKIIHSVGVVGIVNWESNGKHNYTGLFKGATSGFARLSLAGAPALGSSPHMVPGIGLKFFRNRMSSTNMMAMYSLSGQSSFNFFEHDFTNHVPELGTSASVVLRLARSAFAAASEWPTMLGLSDFARYTQDGNAVASPEFPFRLVFHPTLAYHQKFNQTKPSAEVLVELAKGLAAGTVLYEIYAQHDPRYDTLTPIGTLKLMTPATTSMFGDKTMFLQHVRKESDFALRPQWLEPAKEIVRFQQSQSQFFFPDLPWN